MQFDYFYNRDGDRFNYIMLPKYLVNGKEFKVLSSDAKILYSCLLERIGLSTKNNWVDENKRVYIIFTIDEIMEVLNKSNKTAGKILNELEKIGLIERKRQGLGKPNIIYVKDFMSGNIECKSYTSEVKKVHSRNVDSTFQEVKKVHGNNTNYINKNYIKPNYNFKEKGLGEFQNVFLTEKELEELKEKLNYSLENYIDRLSSYIKSTGKEYKNHKATILTWYLKDKAINIKNEKTNVRNLEDYDKGEHL